MTDQPSTTTLPDGVPMDPTAAFRLDGKVVIVTGATSGLGERFARVAAAAGASVVAVGRRADRLESLTDELPGALAVPCDLGVASERSAPVARALAEFGRVDVLVNNAGIGGHVPALDESDEEFGGVLDVNVVASFALAREVARHLLDEDRCGSIINIASLYGLIGLGRMPQAGYAASKGAVINLTRELAAQWSPNGIRVNAIAPGWFDSEMTAGLFESEKGRRWIARGAPLGRPGRPEELDGALLYLASDASSYVTGQILSVDGGWTAV